MATLLVMICPFRVNNEHIDMLQRQVNKVIMNLALLLELSCNFDGHHRERSKTTWTNKGEGGLVKYPRYLISPIK